LQRPHGALIPLAVITYLVATRQLRFDRDSAIRFARIVAIPALTFLGYYAFVSRGLPHQQDYFLDEAKAAGVDETWLLVKRMTVIELVYLGLFILPIAAAACRGLNAFLRIGRPIQILLVLAWEGMLIGGVVWFADENRWMPYIPHFFGQAGPGSGDLRNARPPIAGPDYFIGLTIACMIASLLFIMIAARSIERPPARDRSAAGMLLAIGLWQVVGAVPPSLLFRNWIISVDRYILPLLPFTIWLLLWALKDVKVYEKLAWGLVALLIAFSVAGTRDALVFQESVWSMAKQLNAQGVPDTQMDAGYAWDAYHLWEFGQENGIAEKQYTGAWWTDVYAPATDSTWIIAGGPIPGYTVVSQQSYSAWLQRKPMSLYVLQRDPAPQG
jgi:hypothetical protein